LEALKASQVFNALKAWEKFITDNGGTIHSAGSKPKLELVKKAPAKNNRQVREGGKGKKARVRSLAAECIRRHNGHAHRTVIHEYLAKKKVHLTPKRLTAYLSESSNFTPDRHKGWSVKKSAAA
jgi:hypothetical protein